MPEPRVLEAVVNVSEGRDEVAITAIADKAGELLLDVHSDPVHHRSVYTLAGAPEQLDAAVLSLARCAVGLLDLRSHVGVHPRLGVVDVVPFVPYGLGLKDALAARDRFARAISAEGLPCFFYGPERSLPEVRRGAFSTLAPDLGPSEPHLTAGACCVGARDVLVAYNLVVDAPLVQAREIARALRRPAVRCLGLALGEESQVSFNLIDPTLTGPGDVYDDVAALVTVKSAELVGLLPARVLAAIPEERYRELGLSAGQTIEAQLERNQEAREL
ncbi:MAG: glutamate formimidoyltransferase [Acidimicrobiales bacterium]